MLESPNALADNLVGTQRGPKSIMKPRIFIDGDVGTTGLQIRTRLEARSDIELIRIPAEKRKDPERRAEFLNHADVSILCLPDDAAREAVALVENENARIIDASTAHRTHPDWVYGLPELHDEHARIIAEASRVSNPGCYPTGFIALVRPLVSAGIVPGDWPVTVHAISGYTGGGRGMIERFEKPTEVDEPIEDAYRSYALKLEHKHVEEMRVYSMLENRPLFVPSIARFRQGMIVHVPLQLWALPARSTVAEIHETLRVAYQHCHFVEVAPLDEALGLDHLEPEALNHTNRMRLFVFGNQDRQQVVLAAQLDNLGKGASGAAVQNLNTMLGLPPETGLAG